MAKLIFTDKTNHINVYRADKCDVNGNSRHIVHFIDFLTKEEWESNDTLTAYEIARKKVKGHYWRKYTCKEFGGGFITQTDYCGGKETAAEVLRIRNGK